MRQRPWVLAVLLPTTLLATACVADSEAPPRPRQAAAATAPTGIRLEDVSVGTGALDERAGLYMCGGYVVASAPAGGIAGNSFVVFDGTGTGRITKVDLPRGLRPNARWLLSTECVESGGRPFVSVAYQEKPIAPPGGGGVRAAYSLDGEQLWMRDDLNKPAAVVGGLLVIGSAPEQPETAVDLRTGKTLATFKPGVQARIVVDDNRVVVRTLSGSPVLTTLTGDRVDRLREAAFFVAEERLLFGITPAAHPGLVEPGGPGAGLAGEDVTPSESTTRNVSPDGPTGPTGKVVAYSLNSGKRVWRLGVAPDPLGVPTMEPKTGIVIVVDARGIARGIDPDSGRRLWHAPTELENPRVTAGAGILLFDRLDDRFQKLVDARTGLPLPEPDNHVVDISASGALQIIDGTPTVVPISDLRNPPSTEEPTD